MFLVSENIERHGISQHCSSFFSFVVLTPLYVTFFMNFSSMATARIQELLMEDQEVKTRRERAHKQSAALAKLTKTLGLHEARAAVVSTDDSNCKLLLFEYIGTSTFNLSLNIDVRADEDSFSLVAADSKSDGGLPGAEDWRVAFQEAGSRSSHSQSPSRSSRNESPMHGRSSRSIGSENGDVGASRRTPARTPPPPPPGGGMYKY